MPKQYLNVIVWKKYVLTHGIHCDDQQIHGKPKPIWLSQFYRAHTMISISSFPPFGVYRFFFSFDIDLFLRMFAPDCSPLFNTKKTTCVSVYSNSYSPSVVSRHTEKLMHFFLLLLISVTREWKKIVSIISCDSRNSSRIKKVMSFIFSANNSVA